MKFLYRIIPILTWVVAATLVTLWLKGFVSKWTAISAFSIYFATAIWVTKKDLERRLAQERMERRKKLEESLVNSIKIVKK